MKTRPRYLKPGIYSEGTLRLRDIAEAEFSALDSIRLTKSERTQVYKAKQAYRRLAKKHFDRSLDFQGDTSTLDFYVNEGLQYVLDAHCLPYCYWGSSEGDGASIGICASMESIEEDLRTNDLVYMREATKVYRGLMADISDHGNVALYNRISFGHGYKDIELWSAV